MRSLPCALVASSCVLLAPVSAAFAAAPPPVGPISLDVSPLVASAPAVFTVRGAAPNGRVLVAGTFATQGAVACPAALAPTCLDLPGPVFVVASARADAAGEATFRFTVPGGAVGATVSLQAVGQAGGVSTSTVTTAEVVAYLDDEDGDLLTNGVEVSQWGTDPYAADTDGDGVDDAHEVWHGYDPLDPASFPVQVDLLACEATPAMADISTPLSAVVQLGPTGTNPVVVTYTWQMLLVGVWAAIPGETAQQLASCLDRNAPGSIYSCYRANALRVMCRVDDGVFEPQRMISAPVVLQNTPPAVTGVSISPTVPVVTDDLVAAATTTDLDQDPVTTTFVWEVNGAAVASEAVLPASATQAGDTVQVCATPADPVEAGATVCSSVVTIQP